MAVTKGQLKLIVKECLLEILSEGLGSSSAVVESKKPIKNKIQPHISSVLQQTASKTKISSPHNVDALKEAIKRESGGNKVIADILADTAINTLPTMLENDRSKMQMQPTGLIEKTVAAATPEQLFGEDITSKWASLAFMDPVKK